MATYTLTLPPTEAETWKQRVYSITSGYRIACCLDSNAYAPSPFVAPGYEFLAGLGARRILQAGEGDPFQQLSDFHRNTWLLGYLGYDLKNSIEDLSSGLPDPVGFPEMFFFEPEILIHIREGLLTIEANDPEQVFSVLQEQEIQRPAIPQVPEIRCRMEKDEYLAKVEAIRQHIENGDVYELNLCVDFFAEETSLDPLSACLSLRDLARTPFAAYLALDPLYLCCNSPERFLKKEGRRLLSQPIKGTIRRHNDPARDNALAAQLRDSEKDQAENVMIVDLVRNDLARSCEPGSVRVDELFGIYSFPRVHQMISTVSGTMRDGVSWTEAIRNAFPMGSMTGAPKVMAMKLIEQYENKKRGIYSGALGYVTPEADFDFNVVIRSLAINTAKNLMSYQAGGAITYDSDPGQEWKEIGIKANILNYLSSGSVSS